MAESDVKSWKRNPPSGGTCRRAAVLATDDSDFDCTDGIYLPSDGDMTATFGNGAEDIPLTGLKGGRDYGFGLTSISGWTGTGDIVGLYRA